MGEWRNDEGELEEAVFVAWSQQERRTLQQERKSLLREKEAMEGRRSAIEDTILLAKTAGQAEAHRASLEQKLRRDEAEIGALQARLASSARINADGEQARARLVQKVEELENQLELAVRRMDLATAKAEKAQLFLAEERRFLNASTCQAPPATVQEPQPIRRSEASMDASHFRELAASEGMAAEQDPWLAREEAAAPANGPAAPAGVAGELAEVSRAVERLLDENRALSERLEAQKPADQAQIATRTAAATPASSSATAMAAAPAAAAPPTAGGSSSGAGVSTPSQPAEEVGKMLQVMEAQEQIEAVLNEELEQTRGALAAAEAMNVQLWRLVRRWSDAVKTRDVKEDLRSLGLYDEFLRVSASSKSFKHRSSQRTRAAAAGGKPLFARSAPPDAWG